MHQSSVARPSLPPPYTEIGGHQHYGLLPIQPPFSFDGVSAQVFPLKANPVRLQDFCNDYLTLSDDQSVVYKPALPYVYMMVLDYGRT